ncbi:unnamed protein product, partial [Laminaria digitata]
VVEEILAKVATSDPEMSAYSQTEREVAAGFGEGSPGRSIALLKSGALEERVELIERLQSIRPRHPIDYLKWAEELGKKNDRFQVQLDAIKVFMRDVMRYQAAGERAPIINRDMTKMIARWASAYTPTETLRAIDALNEASDLITRNVNKQMIAEKALRKLKPSEYQAEQLFKH